MRAADEAKRQLAAAIAPDGRGDELRVIKELAAAAIQQRASELPGEGRVEPPQAEALLTAVTQFISEAWQKDCLDSVTAPLRQITEQAHAAARLNTARIWVLNNNMPQFIYFDRYDVLDAAIHIPTFLSQMAT